jgi:hypothetical protein
MPLKSSQVLRKTIERELPHLRKLNDPEVTLRPKGPDSWSPKEELGHLIDSAANNHMRFVRAALEPEYHGPRYAQNAWVRLHAYQETPWTTVVDFWFQYNSLLATLLDQIPADCGGRLCFIGDGSPETLEFIADDYIVHMQHHLDHLLGRADVTPYPA